MKILRSLVQAIAPVACGALVLCLLAGDAMAAKKPPVSLLWPSGAKVVAEYYPFVPWLTRFGVSWPIANDADHYRLTVVLTERHVSPVVVYDESPESYIIDTYGRAQAVPLVSMLSGRTYFVIVTAYAGPDEAVAYSESLQASIRIP